MSNYNNFNNYDNETDGKYYSSDNYNYRDSYDDSEVSEVVGIGTWSFVLIVTAIPFVNIIALFILAFGVKNQNLKNYGKGALIVIVILTLLGFTLRGCTSILR